MLLACRTGDESIFHGTERGMVHLINMPYSYYIEIHSKAYQSFTYAPVNGPVHL